MAGRSFEAFSTVRIGAELVRRDRIRDEIYMLPKEQQDDARRSEQERRRHWDEAREKQLSRKGKKHQAQAGGKRHFGANSKLGPRPGPTGKKHQAQAGGSGTSAPAPSSALGQAGQGVQRPQERKPWRLSKLWR